MANRTSDLNLLFPTPIWTTILPNHKEINKKMFNYIQILRSNDSAGKMKSNVIGWHSQNFNLKDSEPQLFINSISYAMA